MNEEGRRVAIVGSGPSGFYAAEALLKDERGLQVDIIDRLPTPFGLVRGGVAPDHQKIKNVTRVYERIASNERCSFIGNVMVGQDVSVAELGHYYDAIVFTCGAETDRTLNIPGIDLPGSHTATEFVGWYNGHPDYRDLTFDLSHETAVIIGQGNVAVDVTRILAKTVEELASTDIAAHALDQLAESKVRTIHMVGRRGPVQSAFTSKEIRELGELEDCSLHFNNQKDFNLNQSSQSEIDDPENSDAQRNWKALAELREKGPAPGRSKQIVVHFFRSPRSLAGNERVERLTLEKNRLAGDSGNQWAEGTGETVEMDCGLFFRSVGYRGVPIEGLPFDDRRGVFPNKGGRITKDEMTVPGMYAAGWIKRGPSGVIGTNKPDSTETATNLLSDLDSLPRCSIPNTEKLLQKLCNRGGRPVSYDDWRTIDTAEIERGSSAGKPREKFTRIAEMLNVID
jgi:ferredoxin--NADP+ reductase